MIFSLFMLAAEANQAAQESAAILDNRLLQLGVGGFIAITVLKESIAFIKWMKEALDRSNKSDKSDAHNPKVVPPAAKDDEVARDIFAKLNAMQTTLQDLHKMHTEAKDPNHPGTYYWWALSLPAILKQQELTNELLKKLLAQHSVKKVDKDGSDSDRH